MDVRAVALADALLVVRVDAAVMPAAQAVRVRVDVPKAVPVAVAPVVDRVAGLPVTAVVVRVDAVVRQLAANAMCAAAIGCHTVIRAMPPPSLRITPTVRARRRSEIAHAVHAAASRVQAAAVRAVAVHATQVQVHAVRAVTVPDPRKAVPVAVAAIKAVAATRGATADSRVAKR